MEIIEQKKNKRKTNECSTATRKQYIRELSEYTCSGDQEKKQNEHTTVPTDTPRMRHTRLHEEVKIISEKETE